VKVFDLFVIFLGAAQGAVEEPGCHNSPSSPRSLLTALIKLSFTDFMASEIVVGCMGAQKQCPSADGSGRKTHAVR
jgi:hypothetical protein